MSKIKFVFSFLVSTLVIFPAFSQYKSMPCKDKSFSGETCIVKESNGVETFDAADIVQLKKAVDENPNLPWMDIIDHEGSLTETMSKLKNNIKGDDHKKFVDLLTLYSNVKPSNPSDALELIRMFLVHHPKERLHLNNPNSAKVKALLEGLNSQKFLKDESDVYCDTFNQARFKKVMDQKAKCLKEIDNADRNRNLNLMYQVNAELIACEKYCITESSVVVDALQRSFSPACQIKEPCAIDFNDPRIGIGEGHIILKTHGRRKEIIWNAKYDLTGNRNDIKYWRQQLFPQIKKIHQDMRATEIPTPTPTPLQNLTPNGQTGTGS